MRITKDMKMADLIHLNHLLLSVLHRFEISLGFGDHTIEQVCLDNNIHPDFFLEIVNAFHDKDYFPQNKLRDFSIKLIIDYLRKSHKYYHSEKIPEIEVLIDEMLSTCYIQKENISLLKKFFLEYKQELINHTQREEEIVFPYSLSIEEKYLNNVLTDQALNDSNYSIEVFENEHDNVEEKLFDLKNIIIKYLPPPKNQQLCNKLLHHLFSLEQDINDHSRIEDKVLVPKVQAMEKAIQQNKNKRKE